MENAPEKKPFNLKSLFPEIDEDRVETLTHDPSFIASVALLEMQDELLEMQQRGIDTGNLVETLHKTEPARKALRDQLILDGWTETEISAANLLQLGIPKK